MRPAHSLFGLDPVVNVYTTRTIGSQDRASRREAAKPLHTARVRRRAVQGRQRTLGVPRRRDPVVPPIRFRRFAGPVDSAPPAAQSIAVRQIPFSPECRRGEPSLAPCPESNNDRILLPRPGAVEPEQSRLGLTKVVTEITRGPSAGIIHPGEGHRPRMQRQRLS